MSASSTRAIGSVLMPPARPTRGSDNEPVGCSFRHPRPVGDSGSPRSTRAAFSLEIEEAAIGRIAQLRTESLRPLAVDDDGARVCVDDRDFVAAAELRGGLRKLSIVSSKWTMPATAPDCPAIGVVVRDYPLAGVRRDIRR